MNIFSVNYGEGFAVYHCRIHDNRAQYLQQQLCEKRAVPLQ
jgi:hypothetical protein